MEQSLLRIFMKVREHFPEVKEKVYREDLENGIHYLKKLLYDQ